MADQEEKTEQSEGQKEKGQQNGHVQREEEVLKFWDEQKIFQKTLDKTKDKQPYVFFDGPPFATGLPHYGHILVSVIKDAVPRYWTMKGRYVRRRWGWDCHGLPIEQLMEQKLGISGKKQIETLGIDKFNEECRANVMLFVNEWASMVRRIGRFVDFENSYKTMDSKYMESVWWSLKQFWDKDLVYEGKKVLLYCPRCETPVSNFEVAMDNSYDTVDEESVYVKAEITNFSDALKGKALEPHHGNEKIKVNILFWTTTPWTLPGNVALAVGKDIDYVLVHPKEEQYKNEHFILAKSRVEILFNDPEILSVFKGSDLVGISYKPIMDVPALNSDKSYKVYDADFVTTDDGTGVVHTAVVYGEDDFKLGQKVGLPIVQLLNHQGIFNDLAPEYLRGKYYKKTEDEIIQKLEQDGQLFKKEVFSHSVPFCWRCGTRLFYNAIPAWFIDIQKNKEKYRKLNKEQINWFPEHLKEGRFDKGLENAPDWNISRNRYWATPLPFWKCTNKSCSRVTCIGSLEELMEKSTNYKDVYHSTRIEDVDLHRPMIDKIVLECGVCKNEMHRVEEVVDCWVESGSMPFAEFHYPFENKDEFKKFFPAQFVSEYISQTRAWFYVMHVVNSTIFDRAPFENVLATGVILNEKGEKMSKSKKNYPDPWAIIEKYGVDALRYYLLSSSVMQAENLLFNEREVDEIYKKVILILSNVHSFLRMYSKEKFADNPSQPTSSNILDKWILAKLHALQADVTKNMDGYDTVRATRPLLAFINDLSTWYVRRSRDRFKQGNADSRAGLSVLGQVLVELTKLMAPFMPFLSEYIYKDLTGNESVHLADWNNAGYHELSEEEKTLLSKMDLVRSIVELGLSARKEANIKVRQPLSQLLYNLKPEGGVLDPDLERIIAEELNVKKVLVNAFGSTPAPGETRSVSPTLQVVATDFVKTSEASGIVLDTAMNPELKEEGIARELERQVQELRKKFGFKVGEMIDLYYNTNDSELELALINKFDRKKTFALQIKKELEVETDHEAQVVIDGKAIWLGLVKI